MASLGHKRENGVRETGRKSPETYMFRHKLDSGRQSASLFVDLVASRYDKVGSEHDLFFLIRRGIGFGKGGPFPFKWQRGPLE
jgi:hypothetical protein